ncbi:hypothetical protein Z043_124586 [Scleropages formosus]|uniref:Immunoglobulin subtype domain-containing protein n=1 Tax=Scleropages formosus TaxID=113540 RepID=A0A0P7W9Q7_SCLFO|nr:hypothetical protein Z043_124586 [Scleropages formosus]
MMHGLSFPVLVGPGLCDTITVCQEEDKDIRVDCKIESKPNQINNYVFSISKARNEIIINTNSTTEMADRNFNYKSTVVQLGKDGYRLRLENYVVSENTTFICKTRNKTINRFVEKGKMVTCSTISVFLHSCPWLLLLPLSVYAMQGWNQVSL